MDKVIYLDPTKLKAEETGERIVRKIQEWLISETSAGERAALPEDVTQRLLISVTIIPSSLPQCIIFSPIPRQFIIPFHLSRPVTSWSW